MNITKRVNYNVKIKLVLIVAMFNILLKLAFTTLLAALAASKCCSVLA